MLFVHQMHKLIRLNRANGWTSVPMARWVAKVESSYWSICNVVIRNISADIVSPIIAEVQLLCAWVKLHAHNIPNACNANSDEACTSASMQNSARKVRTSQDAIALASSSAAGDTEEFKSMPRA